MRCAHCGIEHLRVLETRSVKEMPGVRRRRYECDDGHKFNTFEINESTARAIGLGTIKKRNDEVVRGARMRQNSQIKRELIMSGVELGHTTAQMAACAGVSAERVRQIRKELVAKTSFAR
jgi:transcriptional regulator NrdR family protein